MDQAEAENGKTQKYLRPGKRFNLTINLSSTDSEYYDEIVGGLNLSFSALVKLGLLLLFWFYKKLEAGVIIKLVYPDGREIEPEILELEKLRVLIEKKKLRLNQNDKDNQGGENA